MQPECLNRYMNSQRQRLKQEHTTTKKATNQSPLHIAIVLFTFFFNITWEAWEHILSLLQEREKGVEGNREKATHTNTKLSKAENPVSAYDLRSSEAPSSALREREQRIEWREQ